MAIVNSTSKVYINSTSKVYIRTDKGTLVGRQAVMQDDDIIAIVNGNDIAILLADTLNSLCPEITFSYVNEFVVEECQINGNNY